MLVIHPKDKTTAMLRLLYDGIEARVLDQRCSNREVCDALNHTSRHERIMLLGHGSDCGLFSREDDDTEYFDRLIVNHSHAYYLRKHIGNIIGVWCNADAFARKEGLHGLFTGMIISELSEAQLYDVPTTEAELNRENVKFAKRLRSLLDEGCPLSSIPARMLALDDAQSPLTQFNYKNIFYL